MVTNSRMISDVYVHAWCNSQPGSLTSRDATLTVVVVDQSSVCDAGAQGVLFVDCVMLQNPYLVVYLPPSVSCQRLLIITQDGISITYSLADWGLNICFADVRSYLDYLNWSDNRVRSSVHRRATLALPGRHIAPMLGTEDDHGGWSSEVLLSNRSSSNLSAIATDALEFDSDASRLDSDLFELDSDLSEFDSILSEFDSILSELDSDLSDLDSDLSELDDVSELGVEWSDTSEMLNDDFVDEQGFLQYAYMYDWFTIDI
ncbi:uncharacterized protein TRAVEDRAFT_48931 [Trametes versicolor FP-101664 SS1]|uniref:uncharacterized protein n=1 Tax=Trametes versicolor (strain FP-101664) TaxID=717944 RepID=UPI0004621C1E|nr:uncharacterized protein TRAVEDRAFT_48931 [Trametes versicolor FP-101664 SS1]EIW57909.1 hypothetical protein TRAVEDRAFT_48931 [Trametes versicolor FP-101664 SS1]